MASVPDFSTVDWEALQLGLQQLNNDVVDEQDYGKSEEGDETGQAIDFDDWQPTDEEWLFLASTPERSRERDAGGVAQRIHEDVDSGGSDDLLTELSKLLDGERPQWLEEEVCASSTGPDFRTAEEKKKDESRRIDMEAAAELQRVRKQRSHRRCQAGECCVYSMRYNPEHAKHRHHVCTHVCKRSSKQRPACGPPLFKSGVFPIFSDEPHRQIKSTNSLQRAGLFASYHRWCRKHKYGFGCS